jgi:hypothetical protein
MKKIIINVMLIVFFMGLNRTSGQNCGDFKNLNISTGLNTSGGSLSNINGLIDPYWQLTNVAPPSINGSGGINIPNAYTINTYPGWCNLPGIVTLNVIPNSAFGTNNTNAAQPWKFRRKFSIRTSGTITISGNYIADDQSELHICDPSGAILFTDNQYGWNTSKSFSKTLQVTQGCYFLEIDLVNVGQGQMGFAVDATVTSTSNILGNPSQACCNGTIISGQKWIDNNCDGVINSGDTPGAGWTFNLISGSSVIQTTTTDAFGQFFFNNVLPGTYTVSENSQPGYTPKNPTSGSQSVTVSSAVPVNLVYFLNCKNSLSQCDCGQWGSIGYVLNNKADKFLCNSITKIIEANKGDIFSLNPQYTCTGGTIAQACNAEIKYDIFYEDGTSLLNKNKLQDVKLDKCGDIRIVMKPTCNGKACPPCEFIVHVNCCACVQDLAPYLLWNELGPSSTGQFQQLKIRYTDIKCGETYTDKLSCYIPYSVQVANPCGENCEPDEVITTIKFTPAAGSGLTGYTITGNSLTANLPGTYDVTIRVKCNGVWCKECKIKFIQTKKCEPPCNNCKVNGVDKVKAGFNPATPPTSYTVGTYPAATTLNAAFVLGGGTDTYTQIRANIVDVQLSSTNPACLQCYNTPNQWGSILGGDLTGFTSAVSTYASVPTISGNNNPREIVFNTTTPVTIPMMTAMNLNLQLPGVSPLSCCCIHVTVFVKITFRNNKCEECSKVIKIEFDECGPKGDGQPPVGTLIFGGTPLMKQHIPSKEDAILINPINPNAKSN